MRIYLLLIILNISLHSCITEYAPDNIDTTSDLLVVDGFIANDVSTIRLSWSVGLDDDISTTKVVDDATVYVEVDNGTEIRTTTYQGDGRYDIVTGGLDLNLRYRLRIKIGSNEFESEFLSPLQIPPIDSIYATKEGRDDLIHVYVATHSTDNTPNYYRWNYKEHWEIHAYKYAEAYHEDPDDPTSPIHYYSQRTSNNVHYCWGEDSSRTLILGTSDRLTENVVSQQKLLDVHPEDTRFSKLYYIRAAQTQLHKEAYNYLENLP